MSDRVGIMYKGRMRGLLEKKDLSQETIMKFAIGV